jgi:pilus assembly protein CpaC
MLKMLLTSLMLGLLSTPAIAQERPSDWPPPDEESANWLNVEVGHSVIFDKGRAVKQFIIGDSSVISAESLSPEQFRVKGNMVGTTNIWVVYADAPSQPVAFDVTVHQDLSGLVRRVDAITDGENAPRAYPINGRLVLEGQVRDVQTLEQVASVARLYDEEFVNLMSVGGDHQVQLQVVFAEVNRTGIRALGLNGAWGDDFLGFAMQTPSTIASSAITREGIASINGGVTQAFSSDTFNVLGTISSDGLNLGALLSVLESNGVSKILAQPTLVALSGQQAEFLAGGEIPIPASQNGGRISIDFKEYGVKLTFVPTVLGEDVIDVRVYVEVSDIDTNNAIRLTGIEIPAFISRKTSSHLRVDSGMTFAMAGMLQENIRSTTQQIPLLGDIPVLGALFRTVDHERDETELMIFVTPRLVRPMAAHEVPMPPGVTENHNPTDFELFLLGMDHRLGSRTAEPTGPIGLDR